MNADDVRAALLAGTVLAYLHPLAALKTEDGRIHAGREAVLAQLAARPELGLGFVPFANGALATVCGTNAAGLALKFALYDGLVNRIVLKRPEAGTRRVRLDLAYDGTAFFGFQRQPELRSVQAELEVALARVNDCETVVNGASRTDAGVHALGQVVHFDSKRDFEPAKWKEILNHALPEDLHVVAASAAHPLFHARFDVHEKEYRYTIDTGEYDPFRRHFCWFTGPLDVGILAREMRAIVGTHDFTSFCKGEKASKVRTISEARIERDGDTIVLVFVGDGFLHAMIRLLAAALVRIAKGRGNAGMAELIAARSRDRTQVLAPAGGLCLVRVDY